MALGSVKRSVREQLELQFDTYLGQIVSYLKDGYRELGFSSELVEEIAATVIVRVSHSNPEPENLEQALFASADDVVRARRPRLSQQKLMDRINGSPRSDLPASLPSLRLIQRLSRMPASNTDDDRADDDGADDDRADDGLAGLGRLSLPNPPVDLQASLNMTDFGGPKELEGASIPSAQIPSLKHEPRFQPVIPSYDDSLDDLAGLREKSKFERGELERELDEQLTGTILIPKIKFLSEDNDDPTDQAPVAMRQPSILDFNEPVDSTKSLLELAKGPVETPKRSTESTTAASQLDVPVTAPPASASSIPPTKESVFPGALANASAAYGDTDASKTPTPTPDVSATRADATAPKAKAKRGSVDKPKAKAHAAPKVKAKPKTNKQHITVSSSEHAVQSFGILPDELGMLAMVGFPDNPRRAARLCVAALVDEVGLSSVDGFGSQVEIVAEALESLKQRLEASGQAHSHAALQWQRAARQATLRAFLNR